MSTDLNTLLSYDTMDLESFEIRGARSGVNNAQSTGTVYVNGQYEPARSDITGSGTFANDTTVSSFSFGAPYGSLNTSSLKVGDRLTVSSSLFQIANIDSPNSFQLNTSSGLTGVYPIQFDLDQREYVVEPDSLNNTSTGTASFISGDTTVTNTGPSWSGVIEAGDFIKHDAYQEYFRIVAVPSGSSLTLASNYTGDTTSGAYTAKKWIIGRTRIQYAKNDITYDEQRAKWLYDAIAADDLTSSTNYTELVDGVELKFSRSLDSDKPDLMDVAVTENTTFAQETKYETFQFALPVVPYPESTMKLYIDGVEKTMYEDYVLSYSQNPVYVSPPPPNERFVANIMFLESLNNINPSVGSTASGTFSITDTSGNVVGGNYPDFFSLTVDGTSQVVHQDYLLESSAGTISVIDSTVDEDIVKYIGIDYSDYVDFGFSVYLNGVKQKISFPAETDDDILFQVASGRLKPSDKNHPGPGESYQINYMVESTPVSDESIIGTDGATTIGTSLYPIKQDSVLLIKNGSILIENEDYFVSYLTGRISLVVVLTSQDNFTVSYTPLSKQVNSMSYTGGKWYCTVHDSRLTIVDAGNYSFRLLNLQLDAGVISILRVYNETRDSDYSLTGIQTEGSSFILEQNATNTSVGLSGSDVVLIDYTFESESTEYYPVVTNNLNIAEGVQAVYIEGSDLTSYIDASTILTLKRPDAAVFYYHTISSATYDSYGTRINIGTPVYEDVVNPKVYIGDSSVSYSNVPSTADSIVEGSSTISFSGSNIQDIFRSKTIMDVNDDLYQVSSSTYESDTTKTVVTLSSEILYDQTSGLSNLRYSDSPYYLEGDTEIVPSKVAVTLFDQPGFIMNYNADQVISVSTTATELTVDGTSFSYSTYPTLADLSSALSAIPSLALTTYVPSWQSDKIEIGADLSVYRDSSTLLSVSSALRYKDVDSTVFVDTTDYSISDHGTVLLDNGLVRGDRYKFDYMGYEFLGDKQVEYTARYFTELPAGSEVKASFQYINLDQFYIQVLHQRDFFAEITVPRMREEAKQLSGSVGQGGVITGDSGNDNAEGGVTGDEYTRKDLEIESRIFNNIFDFFNLRLDAYGNELEASVGIRLFNNDGTFSEVQQGVAYKTVNRVFPDPDYTNFEPMKVNPLTGYFFDSGAKFVNGSTTVTSTGNTLWTKQLNATGFIGSTDSTRRYVINSITNDAELELTLPYGESSSDVNNGESYTAVNTDYPIYDDDGFLGAKIIGTRNENFGISDGDTFLIYLDGTSATSSYTFLDSVFPTSGLTGPLVAGFLSTISGLKCTSELVLDPTAAYGYRTSLVLRTEPPVNFMVLGDTTTTTKLGFTRDESAYGNLDRLTHSPSALTMQLAPPEIQLDSYELTSVTNELGYLNSLVALGSPDKLTRINPTGLGYAGDATDEMPVQVGHILREIPKVEAQIAATGHIMQESGISPSDVDSSAAHLRATLMLADSSAALSYANSVLSNWQGKIDDWKWILDFTEHSDYIRGKDATNVGVPVSSGPDTTNIAGQQSFILQAPAGYDRRILNNTIYSTTYQPVIVDEIASTPLPGTWTGWGVYGYSNNNEITFTLDQPDMIYLNNVAMPGINHRYVADTTALNILWEVGITPNIVTLLYSTYPLVSNMKTALNGITGLSATGPALHDGSRCEAFLNLPAQYINPDATVYPGLRNSIVTYQTISDEMLKDRVDFDTTRSSNLTDRIDYLSNFRDTQIKISIKNEGLLLNYVNGNPSDLYNWANNRFHRRQGCYAKLKQIEQQIASNQSALQINQSFI